MNKEVCQHIGEQAVRIDKLEAMAKEDKTFKDGVVADAGKLAQILVGEPEITKGGIFEATALIITRLRKELQDSKDQLQKYIDAAPK